MGKQQKNINDIDFDLSYRPISNAKSSALRIALLFGSAALALGMIIIPLMNERANRQDMQALFPQGIDMTKTGSIRN
ncbi:hypothetical protein FHS77_001454 [Paenochrobactrum gallinarii]|uniref:Uncharacterized protein n=1 Tax=Paenochrobactrum gallinarii TaxID=643673 RepID=A0A841LS48_9HYPH|nr:hypothetical protein [Paenochrobactrum gallinarii]MBB6260913.1 hypothetical protein [Paenochrobactrum gallinarii]